MCVVCVYVRGLCVHVCACAGTMQRKTQGTCSTERPSRSYMSYGANVLRLVVAWQMERNMGARTKQAIGSDLQHGFYSFEQLSMERPCTALIQTITLNPDQSKTQKECSCGSFICIKPRHTGSLPAPSACDTPALDCDTRALSHATCKHSPATCEHHMSPPLCKSLHTQAKRNVCQFCVRYKLEGRQKRAMGRSACQPCSSGCCTGGCKGGGVGSSRGRDDILESQALHAMHTCTTIAPPVALWSGQHGIQA